MKNNDTVRMVGEEGRSPALFSVESSQEEEAGGGNAEAGSSARLDLRDESSLPVLANILNELDVGLIFLSEKDFSVIYANRAATQLFNSRYEHMVGNTLEQLFLSPSHYRDFFRYADQQLARAGSYSTRMNLQDSTGAILLADLTISEFRTPDHPVSGWIIRITDAGQRQIADAAHIRHERTLERNLANMRKENDDLTTFIYSVSHDLKSPLNQILQYQELLAEELSSQLSADQQRLFSRIRSIAGSALETISSLLILARSSKEEKIYADFDLSGVARLLLERMAGKEIRSKKLTTHVRQSMHVHGDKHLIQVAMENLISNAIKFTGKASEPHIIVGCLDGAQPPVYYVKDNGIGFDARYAEKLFEPFERLHDRKTFPGSGLGLTITRRIIEKHGGRIWARSEPGKGATFFFTLSGRNSGGAPTASA